MESVINIRGMDCAPEIEEKFNKWYNEVHIPMLLKSGQVKRATRFARVGDDPNYPKYLAIYEFEDKAAFAKYNTSPAMAAVLEEMEQSWPEGGFESKWRAQYEAIKTWEG